VSSQLFLVLLLCLPHLYSGLVAAFFFPFFKASICLSNLVLLFCRGVVFVFFRTVLRFYLLHNIFKFVNGNTGRGNCQFL